MLVSLSAEERTQMELPGGSGGRLRNVRQEDDHRSTRPNAHVVFTNLLPGSSPHTQAERDGSRAKTRMRRMRHPAHQSTAAQSNSPLVLEKLQELGIHPAQTTRRIIPFDPSTEAEAADELHSLLDSPQAQGQRTSTPDVFHDLPPESTPPTQTGSARRRGQTGAAVSLKPRSVRRLPRQRTCEFESTWDAARGILDANRTEETS
ncbi:hypothetical protein ABZX75_10480 [Streptomyces sp. NPDC003038]|uniref:hypothetical protein n=1 Tax=unclassified Streptomyces TaxID=2593676 RepID=UPI0033A82EEC